MRRTEPDMEGKKRASPSAASPPGRPAGIPNGQDASPRLPPPPLGVPAAAFPGSIRLNATSISLILCTRDRLDDLARTLAALEQVRLPDGTAAELLILDNGSGASEVVPRAGLPQMPARVLAEPRPGKAYALNSALAAAGGDLLLFTDDDIRPPPDWITRLCRPLLSGEADAVAGGIEIAPSLRRPWMTPLHKSLLASTEFVRPEGISLIGANMAFRRSVLDAVPAFDTELGPGTPYGAGEELLFSLQLYEAGWRITPALDVVVEHHFDSSRLAPNVFRRVMRRYGEQLAYVAYHWEHDPHPFQRRQARSLLREALRRLRHPRPADELCGMTAWDLLRLRGAGFRERYAQERKRPRLYEKRGLVKLLPP